MVRLRFGGAFFDTALVRRAVDRARIKNLTKAGGFVRKTAQRSIRKRKGTSAPGSPPYSHTGTLRRLIFFGYDVTTDSVVVGPIPTNQVFFRKDRKPVTGTVPSVLEYGGTITRLEVQRSDGEWRRADLRSRRRLADKRTRYKRVRIKPRPFMRPALEKIRTKLPELWANSVRKVA